jgi:tRNA threonylcarbamoyladenosine biosynthesis protein TsaE
VIQALSSHHLKLSDEAATQALAEGVALHITESVSTSTPGLVIFLSGPLGTGKTTWVRSLLRAMGHTGRVRSPSFTIMEPYTLGSLQIFHFDFYRFKASEEWREAGFDELIGSNASVSIVEWPEMAEQSLSPPDLWLRLAVRENGEETSDERTLEIQCLSLVGVNLMTRVLT